MDRRDLLRLEVPFGALGVSLVGLAFAFAALGIPAWIPPAPLVRFGVASPLSGMTRSFVALASGDLTGALAWHPLGPVVFAACVGAALVGVVSLVRGARVAWVAAALRRRALWAAVGLAIALVWVRQIIVLEA